ncbi:hypothetical protein Q4E93_20695 [Flavitalea sp. BT771]|uniref:hypothetical protein n=1 Tax=Flavitalea sp. BT771 TaxID=3063329 RepID=UPI0026E30571|nr:hypothetical protein [Flavitalea sp. BT771]MDO6433039.1 hypothetical protein [Flavitalea sp. BT771]MDV6221685.1 hypothetical protein [Flavitalea sp. BT771]
MEDLLAEEPKNPLLPKLDNFKDIFQDANISFLIGSGLSCPYFRTLGSIEIWLTELENVDLEEEAKTFIKASLYKAYFNASMQGNIQLRDFVPDKNEYLDEGIDPDAILNNTYKAYKDFISILNSILYLRRSNTVSKQVNLFTTNIDIFMEKVIEDLDLQYNDGFNGIFTKRFSLSNFKKSYYQKSLQYDNISEIPVFNILKIHGSVTWQLRRGNILFTSLAGIKKVEEALEGLDLLDILSLNDDMWKRKKRDLTLLEIQREADKLEEFPDAINFLDRYEKLQVVNPTKDKFRDTTFNKNYYEILRMYANELEKENSILVVMGFSMADEHIRDITFRAIKSNPTLKVFICAYTHAAKDIQENLKKDQRYIEYLPNVELINPEDGFDLRKANDYLFRPLLDRVTFKRDFKF